MVDQAGQSEIRGDDAGAGNGQNTRGVKFPHDSRGFGRRLAVERRLIGELVRGDDQAYQRRVLAELRLAYRRVTLHRMAIHEAMRLLEQGGDPDEAVETMRDSMEYVIPRSEEQ